MDELKQMLADLKQDQELQDCLKEVKENGKDTPPSAECRDVLENFKATMEEVLEAKKAADAGKPTRGLRGGKSGAKDGASGAKDGASGAKDGASGAKGGDEGRSGAKGGEGKGVKGGKGGKGGKGKKPGIKEFMFMLDMAKQMCGAADLDAALGILNDNLQNWDKLS